MSQAPKKKYCPPSDTVDKVVEVTGMLGESVVSVSHVTPQPPSPSSRRAARTFAAAGAFFLLVSAFAFIKGVANAADNKRTYDELSLTGGKALASFRPHRLSLAYDAMAFGGLACGIAALAFALFRRRGNETRTRYTLGTGDEADFSTDQAPLTEFPLVDHSPLGPVVRITDNMNAELQRGAKSKSLAELAEMGIAKKSPLGHELLLPEEGRLRVELGLNRFFLAWATAPRRQASMLMPRMESRALQFFAASAVLHLAVLALLWSIPPDRESIALETEGDLEYIGLVKTAPMESDLNKPEPDGDGAQAGKGEKPGPAQGAGTIGHHGTPEATATRGRFSVKNRADEPRLAKADERLRARNAGILGVFAASDRSLFRSLESNYDYASGLENEDVYGGDEGELIAAVNGPYSSTWGNQHHNFSDSPYYRDGIKLTNGYITGRPDGDKRYFGGDSTKLPGQRDRRAKRPHIGDAKVVGNGLDKAIIRRHIRWKLQRISHCYERELIVRPELSGTLKTSFTISGNGAVVTSRASGMNSGVANCVSGVIKSIQFPASKDGTMVKVAYPFFFRSTAG